MSWESALKQLRRLGCRSHDTETCGLHIHLSRDFFTVSEIERLVAFINANKTHWSSLARRTSSYASYADTLINSATAFKDYRKEKARDRYTAVNISNPTTIELRIFRGTLIPQTLLATVELADAVGHWIKTVNMAQILNPNIDSFAMFASYIYKTKQYPFLHTYLDRKTSYARPVKKTKPVEAV